MESKDTALRINVHFRTDDDIEAEAIRIIASVPRRKKSHFIAEAIVRANDMTASIENLSTEKIDQLATAIAQRLAASSMTVKRKVGRPKKSGSEEEMVQHDKRSCQGTGRGSPKTASPPYIKGDNHPSLSHAHSDQPASQSNQIVDEELIDSMMDLVNNTTNHF